MFLQIAVEYNQYICCRSSDSIRSPSQKKKSNASSTAEFINPASQGTKSPKQSIGDSQNGGQRSECAQKAGVWPQLVFPDRKLLGFSRLINGKSNC